MKVLVGCEFSGVIREEFSKLGHDAWSCDLLDTEIPGNHIKGNVLDYLNLNWDIAIFHPPCTHLAVSGARHWRSKKIDAIFDGVDLQREAMDFVRKLLAAPIHRICLENPVSIISRIRKPEQIVQPYEFGDPFVKTTCLWLKNLPLLIPTHYGLKEQSEQRCWRMSPSKNRAKERSRTYPGLAKAMAQQWGGKV